jgi:hypothetical protein
VGVRLLRQARPQRAGHRPRAPGAEGLEHRFVLLRVGDDEDVGEVLRRRPDHGRAADVDLFQGGLHLRREGRPPLGRLPGQGAGGQGRRGDRLDEGVEIGDDEVDWQEAVLGELGHVGRVVAPGEDPGVDAGVEGLHPPVQDLRKSCQLGNATDREPRLLQRGLRPAGRVEVPSQVDQLPG